MQYVEAFKKFGYQIENQRQDWSAEGNGGICLTIWKKLVVWKASSSYLDLWELHPTGGDWEAKPGHKKRTRHLLRATREFNGFVDAILVSGEPGEGYGDATLWLPKERCDHSWRITKFEPETGFFRAELAKR